MKEGSIVIKNIMEGGKTVGISETEHPPIERSVELQESQTFEKVLIVSYTALVFYRYQVLSLLSFYMSLPPFLQLLPPRSLTEPLFDIKNFI